jgi:hypothetical protein
MVKNDIARWRALRQFGRRLRMTPGVSLDSRSLKRVVRLAGREAALAQQVRMLDATQRLFRYWHVAHRPVALTALVAVLVHVSVAIALGATSGRNGATTAVGLLTALYPGPPSPPPSCRVRARQCPPPVMRVMPAYPVVASLQNEVVSAPVSASEAGGALHAIVRADMCCADLRLPNTVRSQSRPPSSGNRICAGKAGAR